MKLKITFSLFLFLVLSSSFIAKVKVITDPVTNEKAATSPSQNLEIEQIEGNKITAKMRMIVEEKNLSQIIMEIELRKDISPYGEGTELVGPNGFKKPLEKVFEDTGSRLDLDKTAINYYTSPTYTINILERYQVILSQDELKQMEEAIHLSNGKGIALRMNNTKGNNLMIVIKKAKPFQDVLAFLSNR